MARKKKLTEVNILKIQSKYAELGGSVRKTSAVLKSEGLNVSRELVRQALDKSFKLTAGRPTPEKTRRTVISKQVKEIKERNRPRTEFVPDTSSRTFVFPSKPGGQLSDINIFRSLKAISKFVHPTILSEKLGISKSSLKSYVKPGTRTKTGKPKRLQRKTKEKILNNIQNNLDRMVVVPESVALDYAIASQGRGTITKTAEVTDYSKPIAEKTAVVDERTGRTKIPLRQSLNYTIIKIYDDNLVLRGHAQTLEEAQEQIEQKKLNIINNIYGSITDEQIRLIKGDPIEEYETYTMDTVQVQKMFGVAANQIEEQREQETTEENNELRSEV